MSIAVYLSLAMNVIALGAVIYAHVQVKRTTNIIRQLNADLAEIQKALDAVAKDGPESPAARLAMRHLDDYIAARQKSLPEPSKATRTSSQWWAEKPWKRGTFAENMEPLGGSRAWNFHSTFCRYCGDWIVDSAYYSEHKEQHSPRRGSWNWLHPEAKRRDPEDLQPNHEEWLAETREWADRVTQSDGQFFGNGPSIDPTRERAFHSEEEARRTLEPFGCRVYWDPDSGMVLGGQCQGQWSMSGSREDRLEYERRALGVSDEATVPPGRTLQ